MRKIFQFKHALVLALVLSLGSCASVNSSKNFKLIKTLRPLPGFTIYQYQHLSNGLELFLIPNQGKNALAYVTAFDVGSRDEEKGKTGLAHLFEHMMFRGTESFPDPFKTLASWGGQYNAYTSQDQTVYHQYVPSSLLEQVIKLESERMRKLKITPEILNTERGAVVSERKLRTEDSPMGRLFWELYQTAFDQHTYKLTPIGRQEDIDRASYQDTVDFYRKHYAPNLASIAIAGDFSVSQALAYMDQYYGGFTSEKLDNFQPPKENLKRPMRRKVIRLKTENSIVADAVFAPAMNDPEAYAELLYCVLLADSDIGYLRYELMEKGIAQSIGSSCYPSKDPNLSVVMINGSNGVSAEQLEKAYLNSLSGFEKWASSERIEKIKVYFTASKWSSMRSPMNLAKQISTSSKLAGDPLYGFNMTEEILKVTRDQVLKRMKLRETFGKTRILIQPSTKSDPFK